ncbi:hypothetical protein P7C70_g2876, partial [Phenoliferia sp. Uapishka_3]
MSLFSPSEVSYTSVPLASTGVPTGSVTVPLRADAREPLSYRDVVLETSVSLGTLGSAKVTVGGPGGYTEVWAGVKGEVENVEQSAEDASAGAGKVVVSVECAPTALSTLRSDFPQHLSSLLTTLFSSSSLPPSFLSQLVVLPRSKSWTLTISVLVLSSSGGNVLDLALMAARAALASTRLPATRPIGLGDDGPGGDIGGKDAGFSGLVKGGKAGVNAVDFELLDGGWDEGERLERWEDLPVGLTLNLINQLPHLDATALEESATASQLIVCFTCKGELCVVKQVGEGEIELGRLMPLIREAGKYSAELLQVMNSKLQDV